MSLTFEIADSIWVHHWNRYQKNFVTGLRADLYFVSIFYQHLTQNKPFCWTFRVPPSFLFIQPFLAWGKYFTYKYRRTMMILPGPYSGSNSGSSSVSVSSPSSSPPTFISCFSTFLWVVLFSSFPQQNKETLGSGELYKETKTGRLCSWWWHGTPPEVMKTRLRVKRLLRDSDPD